MLRNFGQNLDTPAIVKHSAKPVHTAITQWLDLVFLEQTHKFYAPLYLPSMYFNLCFLYLYISIYSCHFLLTLHKKDAYNWIGDDFKKKPTMRLDVDIESFWMEGYAGQTPNSGHELAIFVL